MYYKDEFFTRRDFFPNILQWDAFQWSRHIWELPIHEFNLEDVRTLNQFYYGGTKKLGFKLERALHRSQPSLTCW